MDEDGNPENGIRLNIAIHDEMEGLSLDFSSEPTWPEVVSPVNSN